MKSELEVILVALTGLKFTLVLMPLPTIPIMTSPVLPFLSPASYPHAKAGSGGGVGVGVGGGGL